MLRTDSDGRRYETGQPWAEVCYVPTWAGYSKNGPDYRFIATRELLRRQWELPGCEAAEATEASDHIQAAGGERYAGSSPIARLMATKLSIGLESAAAKAKKFMRL